MLALFDKDATAAEDLFSLGTLFVEKCQFPLNLIQVRDLCLLREGKLKKKEFFEIFCVQT